MKKLALSILSMLAVQIFAQEVPDIVTDRPDQTEASNTVPKKTLQIEMGFSLEGDKTLQSNTLNYSLLIILK